MHTDRTSNTTKQAARDSLGNVPMQFAGFTSRDAKLFVTEEALHAALGPKVAVPPTRMRASER